MLHQTVKPAKHIIPQQRKICTFEVWLGVCLLEFILKILKGKESQHIHNTYPPVGAKQLSLQETSRESFLRTVSLQQLLSSPKLCRGRQVESMVLSTILHRANNSPGESVLPCWVEECVPWAPTQNDQSHNGHLDPYQIQHHAFCYPGYR